MPFVYLAFCGRVQLVSIYGSFFQECRVPDSQGRGVPQGKDFP